MLSSIYILMHRTWYYKFGALKFFNFKESSLSYGFLVHSVDFLAQEEMESLPPILLFKMSFKQVFF
jgi:hypothetical protein